MIDNIENGVLVSDLNANHHSILFLGGIVPTPQGLVSDDDPRLSDDRVPLPGSVNNTHVANDAAIDQSKISFNQSIPPSWLGTDPTQGAPGNLVQYLSEKGQPNGYAGLDEDGLLPIDQLPETIGTVTSVDLVMPAEFDVTGGPITSSGVITVDWADVPDGSWFGNDTGGSAPPTFQTTPLPLSLIPDLDASKITSGTIAAARLPAAVGVGVGHAPGLVPDPGASGTSTDYLARDMTYKAVPDMGPTYQPDVDDPTFSTSSSGGDATVNILCPLDAVSIFYSLVSDSSDFQPFTGIFTVTTPQDVWAYAAKEGYNNSNVVTVNVT